MQIIRDPQSGYWDLLVGDCLFCSCKSREQAEIVIEMLEEHAFTKSEPSPPIEALGAWESGLAAATHAFQRRLLMEALRRTGGNKKAAAGLLGMKRSTLISCLKRLEMEAVRLIA